MGLEVWVSQASVLASGYALHGFERLAVGCNGLGSWEQGLELEARR